MKTSGNDLAYPEIKTESDWNDTGAYGNVYSFGGLTKREYFASMAMQGLLSEPAVQTKTHMECIAHNSVLIADELIKALNASGEEK